MTAKLVDGPETRKMKALGRPATLLSNGTSLSGRDRRISTIKWPLSLANSFAPSGSPSLYWLGLFRVVPGKTLQLSILKQLRYAIAEIPDYSESPQLNWRNSK